MLLLSDIALLVVTIGLLANSLLPDPHIWALFAGETLGTAAYGFQRPARNALTPKLVGEDQLLAAIAVEDVVFTLARVVGPALAGVLIAVFGLPGAYGIDVATFAASLIAIWLLPSIPAAPDAERPSLQSIMEGFRHVKSRKVLLGIFAVDTNAMIFGMPRSLFPPSPTSSGRARRPRAHVLRALCRRARRIALLRLDERDPAPGCRGLLRRGRVGRRDRPRRLRAGRLGRARLPRGGRRRRLRQRRAAVEHPPLGDSRLASRTPLGDRARAGRRRARDRERRGRNRRVLCGRPRLDRLGRSAHRDRDRRLRAGDPGSCPLRRPQPADANEAATGFLRPRSSTTSRPSSSA